MRKLLFIIFVLKIKILFGAESYFSIHYNNIHGNSVFQGMKNEGQSVNICSYDNGTSSSCENSFPSIVNNIYYDNGTLKNITNSPADNDTRYFEEKINPMIGTTRVSFGIGLNFLEGTWVGVGTRYGVSLGLAQIYDKINNTIFEGTGALYGLEFEAFTLHEKLSFFGFFPMYRLSYFMSDIIPLYITGQNKRGYYYRRLSSKMTGVSHQYGGSFRVPFSLGRSGTKKGQSTPTAGLFFDFYRDITEADLKIENSNTLKLKSYNSGFSLKWSSPF